MSEPGHWTRSPSKALTRFLVLFVVLAGVRLATGQPMSRAVSESLVFAVTWLVVWVGSDKLVDLWRARRGRRR